ncbi:MAG: hypothetical protein HQL50_11750 [Magnetococcales bacterium]|nr:hypothetical protein [Magnetococcales bacterium]
MKEYQNSSHPSEPLLFLPWHDDRDSEEAYQTVRAGLLHDSDALRAEAARVMDALPEASGGRFLAEIDHYHQEIQERIITTFSDAIDTLDPPLLGTISRMVESDDHERREKAWRILIEHRASLPEQVRERYFHRALSRLQSGGKQERMGGILKALAALWNGEESTLLADSISRWMLSSTDNSYTSPMREETAWSLLTALGPDGSSHLDALDERVFENSNYTVELEQLTAFASMERDHPARIIRRVERYLTHPVARSRYTAARLLFSLQPGHGQARAVMAALLSSADEHGGYFQRAVAALLLRDNAGQDAAGGAAVLRSIVSDDNATVVGRRVALEALVEAGVHGSEMGATLQQLARSGMLQLRLAALTALLSDPASDAAQMKQLLIQALNGPDAAVRTAVGDLILFRESDDYRRQLRLLPDENQQVGGEAGAGAAGASAVLLDPDLQLMVIRARLLETDQTESFAQIEAMQALVAMQGRSEERAAVVRDYLQVGDDYSVLRKYRLLAESGVNASLASLFDALPTLRESVVRHVQALLRSPHGALFISDGTFQEVLLQLASDATEAVAIELLLEMLEESSGEEVIDIMQGLVRFGRDNAQIRRRLNAALIGEDVWQRKGALDALLIDSGNLLESGRHTWHADTLLANAVIEQDLDAALRRVLSETMDVVRPYLRGGDVETAEFMPNDVSRYLVEKGRADFPWPPPEWVSREEVPSHFLGGEEATLEEVADRLIGALRAASVDFEYGLFDNVPGGFALVARLERIHQNGEPYPGLHRWSNGTTEPILGFRDYLIHLFMGKRGYFRVVAFIVTDQARFGFDSSAKLPELKVGSSYLEYEVARLPFKGRHCHALIYTLERKPGGRVVLGYDSAPSGRGHLMAAGIWQNLTRNAARSDGHQQQGIQ